MSLKRKGKQKQTNSNFLNKQNSIINSLVTFHVWFSDTSSKLRMKIWTTLLYRRRSQTTINFYRFGREKLMLRSRQLSKKLILKCARLYVFC